MIPLIRPLMPPIELLNEYLQIPYGNGIWSNFGSLNRMAESKIKEVTGFDPVFCNSGASALEVSLEMLGVDESAVIAIPDFTHAATLLCTKRCGAHPLLVSCDARSMAMDLNSFHDLAKDEEIDAAIIVNPFGYGIDRKAYADIAMKFGISLVFDYAGAWGDFPDFDDHYPTVYSFHATKSIPIGEGGMVLVSSERQYEEIDYMRRLTNFSTSPDRMIIEDNGQNAKLSELSAAMLCAQLDGRQIYKIDDRISRRRFAMEKYARALGRPERMVNCPSLCVFPFPELHPLQFQSLARQFGFIAQQYYIPLRSMPAFLDMPLEGAFPKDLDRCMALPADASEGEMDQIIDAVLKFLPD